MNLALPEPRRQRAPQMPCDCCGLPMTIPDHCMDQGVILGLLVCTACVEDALEANTHDRAHHYS